MTTEVSRPLATAPLTPAFATATAGEIELISHLLGLKAKALAWVAEDPANRWSSNAYLEPTVEWLREMGWGNVHDYALECARSLYCDFHKDVHGIKARWAWEMTLEECEAGIRQLERDAELEAIWRKRNEEARLAEEAFEAELLKGAPDLSPVPDPHEVFAGVFRLGA
jgi:hypothetical protein